jgi:UDPglucose--hexose-1-phosphate uridylyltransferase
MLQLHEHPHKRLNLLTGDWVLVSPHRNKRPWQGKVEALPPASRPAYDAACYLCPRNKRADGDVNTDYSDVFVFTNDFSALLPDTPAGEINIGGLLQAKSEKGICRVISFSPRHDLTLAEMETAGIKKVVDLWQQEFATLAHDKDLHYIQIFENKGEIMGCSNPHPHGQIWASAGMPVEIEKETRQQEQYFTKHKQSLLSAYLELELAQKERIIADNEHFTALVPFWAVWPFETIIISKRHIQDITQFSDAEKESLSNIMRQLLIAYDNLFETSFPYSAGMHQRPVNSGPHEAWHWHMHFYPPLLRSATVKKFMVGYEMLGNPQRDVTAEWAAEKLRNLPQVHYKKKAEGTQ